MESHLTLNDTIIYVENLELVLTNEKQQELDRVNGRIRLIKELLQIEIDNYNHSSELYKHLYIDNITNDILTKKLSYERFNKLLEFINNLHTLTYSYQITFIKHKLIGTTLIKDLEFMLGLLDFIFTDRKDIVECIIDYSILDYDSRRIYHNDYKGCRIDKIIKTVLLHYKEMTNDEKLQFLFRLDNYLWTIYAVNLHDKIIEFMNTKLWSE
jgi:hypothetical protein